MKRRLLTILFSITTLYSFGQKIKLNTDNPSPRVGNGVRIHFTIEKTNLDSADILEEYKFIIENMNEIALGSIEISDAFLTETGPLKIGPLKIPINGKVYTTNEIILKVDPPLPSEIDNGIWIRFVNIKGEKYLIYEQRLPFKRKQNEDGEVERTMTSSDANWASLDEYKLYSSGLEIERKIDLTSFQSVDVGHGTAHYRRTIYKCEFRKTFKGQITIDKSFIIQFPENGIYENVIVKN